MKWNIKIEMAEGSTFKTVRFDSFEAEQPYGALHEICKANGWVVKRLIVTKVEE